MKKKLISLLMTLVMILTLVPGEVFAVMRPLEETGSTGSEETEDTQPGGGEESETPPPAGENNGPFTKTVHTYTHPTHLTSGEIDLKNYILADPGILSFNKGEVTVEKGNVKVTSWSVGADKLVKFTLSGGKDGDVINLNVTADSSAHGSGTLRIKITLGYSKLTIISPATVVFGSKLKLACAGLEGAGTVIYEVSGDAELEGDVLIPTKAGTASVRAVQVSPQGGEARYSDSMTVTITKATPTGSPTFTKLAHAGLTLADANLMLGRFSVEGSVEWVLSEDTVVIANTAYEWEFFPKDSHNYNSIKGTVTPYTVSENIFAVGEGVTEENTDGSFTTITFGEDDSSYKLTEYPDGSMTLVHTKMDGTVTTTEKKADGTRTETIEKKDGSKQVTATDKSGITHTSFTDRYGYASAQVYIPSYITTNAAKSGAVIELPIPELPCTDDRSDAPTITFTLHTTAPVRVSIPVNSPTSGTVAITVAKNGQESVVKTSTTGYDSVEVTLNGSTTLKVADLSKRFTDVDHRHWYKDAADFATSRGLFNGVTAFEFDAHGHMSRAMLVQVLHNLEGNPYYGYGGYYGYAKYLSDVEGKWYEDSAVWAIANGHIGGYEDGTFRGELDITREQLAVILYRYAGYPSVKQYVNTSLTDYLDYKKISPYAYEAMYWALCSGVLYTAGGDKLSPQQPVTRAEVAQTFKNLVEFLVA